MTVILGNIVSFIACVILTITGIIKDKSKIIIAQVAQFGLMAVSSFLLGAMGGVIANCISLARNVIIAKWKWNPWIKYSLLALQIIISVPTITTNPITWLPLLASGLHTLVIDTDNIFLFKWAMIATLVMWAIYDLSHLNFVSVWFDAFTIISNLWSMWKIKKETGEAN